MAAMEGFRTLGEKWNWQVKGACRGMDTNTFFYADGDRGKTRERKDIEAKKVCAKCPVMEQCREYSLEAEEPYGIWGGLTEKERDAILKKKIVR